MNTRIACFLGILCAILALPERAFADPLNIPDQTPILQKIEEAQRIAFLDEAAFKKILKDLREKEVELEQIQKIARKKKTEKQNFREEELRKEIILLREKRDARAEQTALYLLDKETGLINIIEFDEKKGFPMRAKSCVLEKLGGNGHGLNLLVLCKNRPRPVLALAHFHLTEKIQSENIPHVYTPYSDMIHDMAIVHEGKKYLRETIMQSIASLTEKKVPSKAYFGEFISVQYSKEYLETLLLVEHVDDDDFSSATPSLYKGSAKSRNPLSYVVEKVYVIDGANKERSKIFSLSKANACCRAQFTEDTYRLIVNQYPEAKLNANFFKGMRDHQNAIQAMILLSDYNLSSLSKKSRVICGDPKNFLECLAAAYNGGVERLDAVVAQYGASWKEAKSVKRGKHLLGRGFRPETALYIKKFAAVSDYLKKDNPS